ncbi:hypothetical protein GCM10027020_06490 [Nocardioides salsibiostraticola]
MFTSPPPASPAQTINAPASVSHPGHAGQVVQRIADGAIWLVFRLDGVRS